MGLAEWFGVRAPAMRNNSRTPESESVRNIMTALGRLDPDRARYLAAFARLLGRVARADLDISESELAQMREILHRYGGLGEDHAALVVEITRNQSELFGGIDDFQVARAFREMANRDQKLQLLHCLFAVAAADGTISAREDHEIRNIARELGLEHADYIDTRLHFRAALGVLRNQSDSSQE